VASNRFTGEHQPPEKNVAEQTRFWSTRNHIVEDAMTAAHHEAFNRIVLEADIMNLDSNKDK
jgi:hypothetical protein